MVEEKIIASSQEYAESIIDTVREPLIALDQDLRVVSASRSFYSVFKVKSEETVGQLIYDLGNKQWDIPRLRELLETILPKQTTFDDYEVEHVFSTIGRRIMLLNARQIQRVLGKERIILLSIEDITERKRLEDLVAESEERYRRLFETATDGIVLLEKREGRIVRANPAAEKMLGYSEEECIGKIMQDIGVPLDFNDFPAIMETLKKCGTLNYDDVPVNTRFGQEIYTDIYIVDRAKLAQCNVRDVTERKLSDNILREEKKFIENALNTLQDIFFVFDLEGRFIRWNKTMNAVTGYSDSEIALMTVTDFFRKDDMERISEAIREVFKEGSANIEAIGVTKDGRQIPYEWSAALLSDVHGNPIGISGVGRNIAERKKAADALRESEERFRLITESAKEWIWEVNSEGLYTYSSQVVEEILGYTPEEVVGKKHYYDFFPSDKREQIKKETVEAFGAKKAFAKYVNSNVHKNGSLILLETSGVPILDSSGDIIGYRGVDVDITERKQAERDLRTALIKAHEGESRAEAIMTSMGEGLSIQDTDFVIIYQNNILKDFRGDHIGEHCYTAYENRDHVCEGCPVAKAYGDGGIHKAQRSVTIGKATLHVEVTASPLRDLDGNIVAGIEVIRDVSDQKKLEAQLRHSQKMEAVGTLAGGIAHDFNNILNVIMGYGAMAMDKLEAGSPSKTDMNEVLIAADRAANLTKKLLVFSRKQVVEVKPVNINEVILGLQKMLVRIIRESIEFSLDLAGRPLIVLADAGLIEQVLINLATNARDAMLEGGRLTLGTGLKELDEEYVAAYGYGKPGKYAMITVTDTGSGMDAETQKKIFEPFFTTKGVGEGTGLGLAISYGIIKQLSGYIQVYSEPGQGTVFKIYLPLSEEAALLDKMAEAAVPVKVGNETVLVAEDDAALRKLTRVVLESFGYSVICAEDGEEAITKFMENRERISLVLLDMIMPKKNGKEVGEAIRKVRPRIKLLFSSGYSMDIIRTKELAADGFDFIHKPFRSKDLLIKVREILDR